MIAERICRDTKLPSLEVSVDRNDVVGACDHGYACAYMNSLAWKTPTTPLPSETQSALRLRAHVRHRRHRRRAPGSSQRRSQHPRWTHAGDLRTCAGGWARAIAPSSGSTSTPFATWSSASPRPSRPTADFSVPEQPVGVPETFKEYVELMFDLQALAFQADITRVSTFMMARENINRCVSGDRFARGASLHFAPRQQSGEDEDVREAEYLSRRDARTTSSKKLQATTDGDGSLLDHTAVLFGSGISDGNVHNNYSVPVVVVGGKSLQIKGESSPALSEGHAAGEPDAGSDGQVRRGRGEVRRQHRRDRSVDGVRPGTRG